MFHSAQTTLIALSLFSFPIIIYSQNDSIKIDSTLLNQIEQEMNGQISSRPVPQARTAASALPDISVIGDFQASCVNNADRNFNAGINEVELSFQSVVDPYARADFFITMGKDPETGAFSADLEEGYVTTTSLPAHLQLKGGKFKSALGKINPVHPHALPFISLPTGYENYFGEGINDEGALLSWLVPNSLFYQELAIQITVGPIDNPSFTRSPGNKWLKLLHLKNFFNLSSNATLEAGFTGIFGANQFNSGTAVASVDLTYKWKPVQYNTYKSFTWQSEAWISRADTSISKSVNTFGLYSFINFQFSKRLFFTGMYSVSNKPLSSEALENSYSTTIGWYATEFQKIEIELKTFTSNTETNLSQIMFRWVFVIGTHGAHQY